MNSFKTVLMASLLLSTSAFAQDWTALDSGTVGTIRDIETSFSEYWIVGDGGFVALSDVARTTWTPLDIGTTTDLYSVRRPASTQFWVSGANGLVRENTASSGWHIRDIATIERFVMYSRESGCQNALGSEGSIYYTCDSGASWLAPDSGTGVSLNHGAGFITSTSWVVGDEGTILISTDGSVSWTPQDSGTNENLNHIVEIGRAHV